MYLTSLHRAAGSSDFFGGFGVFGRSPVRDELRLSFSRRPVAEDLPAIFPYHDFGAQNRHQIGQSPQGRSHHFVVGISHSQEQERKDVVSQDIMGKIFTIRREVPAETDGTSIEGKIFAADAKKSYSNRTDRTP